MECRIDRKQSRPLLLMTVLLMVITLLVIPLSTTGCKDSEAEARSKLGSALRGLIEDYEQGKSEEYASQGGGIELVDGNKVMVQIDCRADQFETAIRVTSRFGTVEGSAVSSREGVIGTIVPIESLTDLAKYPSIGFIRVPVKAVAGE